MLVVKKYMDHALRQSINSGEKSGKCFFANIIPGPDIITSLSIASTGVMAGCFPLVVPWLAVGVCHLTRQHGFQG